MRRLVICFDGTWNRPDQKGGHPTNIVRLARAVKPVAQDGTTQIVFYDAGVGTGNLIDRLQGGIFGHGLDQNIQEGYRFLAHNYQFGDEVYFFGFSRGAFTARSLAGFIGRYGLVHKASLEHLATAWKCYRTEKSARDRADFRKDENKVRANADTVIPIKVVGVWDTVGALGVPGDALRFLRASRYQFHDTQLSDKIEYAFHAMAIDEKRGPFEPTLWEQPSGQKRAGVEQVWFCGVHSNVGGSYPDERLANLTLNWMIDRVTANSGLEFDQKYLRWRAPIVTAGKNASPYGTITESRTFLYFYSRWWPRLRNVIGRYAPGHRGRTHFPSKDCEFVNEMLHWSVVQRVQKHQSTYQPINVPEQLGRLPIASVARQTTPIAGH